MVCSGKYIKDYTVTIMFHQWNLTELFSIIVPGVQMYAYALVLRIIL